MLGYLVGEGGRLPLVVVGLVRVVLVERSVPLVVVQLEFALMVGGRLEEGETVHRGAEQGQGEQRPDHPDGLCGARGGEHLYTLLLRAEFWAGIRTRGCE